MSVLQTVVVCPNLLLFREGKVLLLKRSLQIPFFGGYWHVPTGKVEGDESPRQAIIREAYEEIGLNLDPQLGTVVAVKAPHFTNPDALWKDISLFFVVENCTQTPLNKEPHLHTEMK